MQVPATFSPNQRALLEKLRGTSASAKGNAVTRLAPGSAIQLSFAQQRLWILDQLRPHTPLYNVPLVLRLQGRLDPVALDRSLVEILGRHEALRTVFPEVDGVPVPRLRSTPNSLIQLQDLDQADPNLQAQQVAEILHQEASQPFLLGEGPLVRALLLRLGPECHVLAITMHHMVCDAWSMPILVKEMSQHYEAFVRGWPRELAQLPVQFSDYAVWQRSRLSDEMLADDLRYWREHLAGTTGILELPLDFPRPRAAGWASGAVPFALGSETSLALRLLGQRHGATAFMITLATFYAFLYRYTGQSDIVVGCPISNRSRPELEGLIGFFVNTLAVRIQIAEGESFLALLSAVRNATLGAFEHAELPFEKLVGQLRIERDLSRDPLFQVMLAWQSTPPVSLGNTPLSVSWMEGDAGVARFDLTLLAHDTPDGISGSLRYKTELFQRPTIERMLKCWQQLITSAVADPTSAVGCLAMMSEADTRDLVAGCNATQRHYQEPPTIIEMIARVVRERPEALAVEWEGERLSYGELDVLSNQVAHALQLRGVGPEVCVGVCLERGLTMVVGLLGVLKAGGAYVPMEPGYPAQRLGWIAEDAGLRVVLSERRWAGLLPAGIEGLWLDGWEVLSDQPATAVATELNGDNLAYVIYTSGSTGRPKGAMNTHAGLRNRLLWMQEYFGLEPSDTVLQKTPFSFDVSVWEFWWPLMIGARLVMARAGGHQDSGYLAEMMEQHQVSTVHFVPSMLEVFLEEDQLPAKCRSLRRVVCSGEGLSRKLQERFEQRLGCGLYNLYGPTEASVDVTVWACERGSAEAVVPIGRPIANMQVHVVDGYGSVAPVGVSGELYLGGVGLGRGYLGRPDWTAERWVPDSVSGQSGQRLYRTGDVGRRRADGAVEYLGRADQQVKLRGFRIELGEIEAQLQGCAGVREAVVIALGEGAEQRLIGYVAADQPLDTAALRRQLQTQLPDYMVPAILLQLPRLPLSANGKLDRKALPLPDQEELQRNQTYDAPRDPIEIELCRMWEEALRVPGIGIHQNFFDLGGYSLMAVALVNKLRKRFLITMPVAAIFEAPTVAQLAIRIRDHGSQEHHLVLPYRSQGTRPPFFCVHAASGTVLAFAGLARALSGDQPFYAIQAQGVEGEAEPLTTVHDMAARYLPELRAARPHGPYLLGGWSLGGLIAIEMARTLEAQGESVPMVVLFDAIVPLGFDWEARHGARDARLVLAALMGRLDEQDTPANLSDLSPDEQLALVIEAARRLGRVPPDFGVDQVRTQLRVLNINLEADLRYRPQSFSGRVVLFRAEGAIGRPCEDLDGGWGPFLPALETCLVPGDHYSMLLESANCLEVARELNDRSAEIAAHTSPGSAHPVAIGRL